MLKNPPKKILLCICGSIAAYKSLELIRILQDKGIEVNVAMSEAAQKLITPLSFEIISKNEVILSTFQTSKTGKIEHIEFAQEVDLILVAPATANILSKFAYGLGDDLISTILLAASVPIIFAPAMNDKMWEKEIVQNNIKKAKNTGAIVLDTTKGLLACNSYGMGKMLSPESIAEFTYSSLFQINHATSSVIRGKKVLITLGATREYLDPFRFITNASSGKMGLEIAKILKQQLAEVFLICGDLKLDIPSMFSTTFITSTEEMADQVLQKFLCYDIIIMCAAVTDYKTHQRAKKIKQDKLQVTFTKTIDILYELGKKKSKNQILVGFAAETDNLEHYAVEKLQKKNLDLIFANKIGDLESGFGSTNTTYQIISKQSKGKLTTATKTKGASDLVSSIKKLLLPNA